MNRTSPLLLLALGACTLGHGKIPEPAFKVEERVLPVTLPAGTFTDDTVEFALFAVKLVEKERYDPFASSPWFWNITLDLLVTNHGAGPIEPGAVSRRFHFVGADGQAHQTLTGVGEWILEAGTGSRTLAPGVQGHFKLSVGYGSKSKDAAPVAIQIGSACARFR